DRICLLSLDIVIIEHDYVIAIRERITEATGIPGESIMISATHNHACPAVVDRPWSAKDQAYVQFMLDRVVEAAVQADQDLTPATQGVETGYEARVSFNRRFIMKDGTVITHPGDLTARKDILHCEGPIDPELAVTAFRAADSNKVRGILVNFACHAVHHMGDLSGGYPGVLVRELKKRFGDDCTVLFLNGACGNIHHTNHSEPTDTNPKEAMGTLLAERVVELVGSMTFTEPQALTSVEEEVFIPYRDFSGLERDIKNMERHNVMQSLIERKFYTSSLEKLKAMHRAAEGETVILQALRIGEAVFATVPAEYFCENALAIKEASEASPLFLVTLANGWVGYVPHPEAFKRRGGHETTWCTSSKMDENAGRLIADRLLELTAQLPSD
ncbi:MAG: hypothetical protein ACYTGH_10695, partial [Planctomycetota bacterium]